MAYQPQYQQHNNHTRGRPETGHTAKQHPRQDTSDAGTSTAPKHGRPGPYGPPCNPDWPTTGEPAPANQRHAPGTPQSQHIHRGGQAGRRNPQNKRGTQPKRRLTKSARATQPATDQTAEEQRPDNEQTTRKPANTQPARHAGVETGTASHGLATTCCATHANHHTHKHNRTPQRYHYKPDKTTLTNYTTLHLDKPRRGRAGYRNNIRLYDHQQQRDKTQADQADHEAAKTTAHQPHRSCSRDLTVNRPDASRPTPNQPGVHGSKRKRRPTGWPHRGAPSPPTTIPRNKTEYRDSTVMQPTNQH